MQENTLDRVRKDLATINAAMGKELPFGAAEVRLHIAIAVAFVVFGVSHALGAHRGWPLFLSGLPLILAFTACMGYYAVKARRRSTVNVTRRKAYRTELLIALPVVLAALAGKHWAARAGLSHLQFGGVLLAVIGCVYLIVTIISPRPAKHPRSFFLVVGLPMIVTGLWIPFCTHTQAVVAGCCMGAAILGLTAIVMHYHLCRQDERLSDAAD